MSKQVSALEMVVAKAKRDQVALAMELYSHADSLLSRMKRLMEACNDVMEGKAASVNSLGEVQSRGGDVDRLCALLMAGQENVKSLEWLQSVESVAVAE
jgi:hypothetical protein